LSFVYTCVATVVLKIYF